MAKLTISEYALKGRAEDNIPVEMAKEPRLRDQVVTIAASSTASAVFLAETRYIRIAADTTCSFVIGGKSDCHGEQRAVVRGHH